MLIRQPTDIPPSEITPPEIYRERRRFMQGMGALAAGAVLGAAPEAEAGAKLAGVRASIYRLEDAKTPYKDVTTYNKNKVMLGDYLARGGMVYPQMIKELENAELDDGYIVTPEEIEAVFNNLYEASRDKTKEEIQSFQRYDIRRIS